MAKAFKSATNKISSTFRKLVEAKMSLNSLAVLVIGSANQLADTVHKTTNESSNVNSIAVSLSRTMQEASNIYSEVVEFVDTALNSLQEMSTTIAEIFEIANRYGSVN